MNATATITTLRERRRRPAAMLAGIAMALSLSAVLSSGPLGAGESGAARLPALPEFTPYPLPASSVSLAAPAYATATLSTLPVTSPAWTQTATHYLASNWKLADSYARRVAIGVARASVVYRLDPMLLLAIAATESSFHHDVGNPGGGNDPLKPYGIMQVAGEYHRDKFPGGQVEPTTVEQNISLGAAVLRQYLNEENGDVRLALRRYGGTANDRYYLRVNHFSTVFHRELAS